MIMALVFTNKTVKMLIIRLHNEKTWILHKQKRLGSDIYTVIVQLVLGLLVSLYADNSKFPF